MPRSNLRKTHVQSLLEIISSGHSLFQCCGNKVDGNNPTCDLNPRDYGLQIVDGMLEPDWYAGNSVPDSLGRPNDDEESDETHINIMNQDDEYASEWSEESDDSENDG